MQDAFHKPAVFLDRDKTLIDDPGYISHPDQVRLLRGAAEAVARLRDAGFSIVVVTNQSGVARGLITEDDLKAIHLRLRDLLRAEGTDLDGVYYCPYLDGPEAVREEYRRDSDLRKPRPGMLLQAAEEMGLDLARSWAVGDSLRDVQAGLAAGCRTILIGGDRAEGDVEADFLASDLLVAAEVILQYSGASTAQTPVEESAPGQGEQVYEAESAGVTDAGSPYAPAPSRYVEPDPPPAPDYAGEPRYTPPPTTPPNPGLQRNSSRPASEPSPQRADERSFAAMEEALGQIHEELHMMRRERQYDDFSIAKLIGAVAEAFALCALGWALYKWAGTGPGDPEGATAATIWLLAGIAFQLLALTCLVASIRK